MRIHINFVSFVCLFLFFFSLFFCLPPIIYVCPLTNINHTQKNEKNTHVSLMQEKALFGSFYGSSLSNNNNAFYSKNTQNHNSLSNGANLRANHVETTTTLTWAFQAVPTLYSVYQKVEYHKKYIYTICTKNFLFYMLFYKSKKSSFTIYDTLTLTILLHFVSVYFIFFSFLCSLCCFSFFLVMSCQYFYSVIYYILLCRFI